MILPVGCLAYLLVPVVYVSSVSMSLSGPDLCLGARLFRYPLLDGNSICSDRIIPEAIVAQLVRFRARVYYFAYGTIAVLAMYIVLLKGHDPLGSRHIPGFK